MNILHPQTVEDYLVCFLQKKSETGTDLLALIQNKRPGTTKQALYSALRKLKLEEIIVMHNMRISLSSVWVVKMTEFFQLAKHFYVKSAMTDEGFLNLEDGDRIAYSFKSPIMTDVFWGHAFDILAEVMPVNDQVYIYNPHEWFFLARHESERLIMDRIIQAGKQIFLMVAGTKLLDKMTSKEADGNLFQFYATDEQLFEKRNYYLNVFGDFILEAWIDENVARKIDRFYETVTVWNDEAKKRLQNIVAEEGKNKLVISRNMKRAEKFKKMMGKYFYIKNV